MVGIFCDELIEKRGELGRRVVDFDEFGLAVGSEGRDEGGSHI